MRPDIEVKGVEGGGVGTGCLAGEGRNACPSDSGQEGDVSFGLDGRKGGTVVLWAMLIWMEPSSWLIGGTNTALITQAAFYTKLG